MMDRAEAIRLAEKWSQGHVCTLRDGEKEEYHKLCLAALREQEQSQWISVKERLPKGRRDYLCVCVYGESTMQFYNVLMFHPEQGAENGYVTGPHFSNEGMEGMRVTHWMPLPEPPKEGAE